MRNKVLLASCEYSANKSFDVFVHWRCNGIGGRQMQIRPNFILRTLILGALWLGLSGCAVYMAANQPDKKDVNVLKAGTPRTAVIAELGPPVQAITRDGAMVDLYTFTQGYSGLEKGGRAVLHGAADVFTMGLWEVVGTPIEGVANGTKVSVEVTYDQEERVAKIVPISGQEKLADIQ